MGEFGNSRILQGHPTDLDATAACMSASRNLYSGQSGKT